MPLIPSIPSIHVLSPAQSTIRNLTEWHYDSFGPDADAPVLDMLENGDYVLTRVAEGTTFMAIIDALTGDFIDTARSGDTFTALDANETPDVYVESTPF